MAPSRSGDSRDARKIAVGPSAPPMIPIAPDSWSEKSSTYRTRKNNDFVAAVENLLQQRGLGRNSPIILMCQAGSRAPIAARLLHEAGFGKVYTQYQGFEGIKAKNGPAAGSRVVGAQVTAIDAS